MRTTVILVVVGLTGCLALDEPEGPDVGSEQQAALWPQGLWPQGLWPQGLWPQGTTPGAELEIDFAGAMLDGYPLENIQIHNSLIYGWRYIPGTPNIKEIRYPNRTYTYHCGPGFTGCTYVGMTASTLGNLFLNAHLSDGTPVVLHIWDSKVDTSSNTMVPNPFDPPWAPRRSNSDYYQYWVEARVAGGPWQYLCGEPSDPWNSSNRAGMFVDGSLDAQGYFHKDAGVGFSCNRGLLAKCQRGLGYKPGKVLKNAAGVSHSMDGYHQACLRGLMADYCGSSTSFTVEGTWVSMWDNNGYNTRDVTMLAPEGVWGAGRVNLLSERRWEEVEPAGACEPNEGLVASEDLDDTLATNFNWNSPSNYEVAVATSSHCAINPCTAGGTGVRLSRGCSQDIEDFCGVYPSCCDSQWSSGCAARYINAGFACTEPLPQP